jgi:hypothetical protein
MKKHPPRDACLVPGIHVLLAKETEGVDGWGKCGHNNKERDGIDE